MVMIPTVTLPEFYLINKLPHSPVAKACVLIGVSSFYLSLSISLRRPLSVPVVASRPPVASLLPKVETP